MAIRKVPKEISEPLSTLGDHGEFGQPLFSKLVPYAVHIAETIYVERRDRLVNNQVIDELENMTSRIHDLLQSLNLPGSLQALERPLGIPPGLTSHAEEIRQQDGLNRLYRSVNDITKLRMSDLAIFNEAIETLQGEAGEDERARSKYGTLKWTRPRSKEAGAKLYKQCEEIHGYLKSAEASDELVKNKLKEWEGLLRLLAGRDQDLEKFVPSSRRSTMSPQVEKEVGKLRAALNDVCRLESRRTRKVQSVREKAKADDISTFLTRSLPTTPLTMISRQRHHS
jgi:programmed cell death 6-interacting protein